MQKDYAKYTFKQKPQLVEHGWRYRLLLVIFMLGILCFIGYGYYLYIKQPDRWNFSKIQSFFIQKPEKKNTLQVVKKQEAKQENAVQFHFYTELPSGQVAPVMPEKPVEMAENKPLPVPSNIENSKKGQYVLQVAAFKNVSSAGDMRISLLLAGFEVDMVKSMTDDRQLLYLIQQGPYPSLAQAKSVQKQMKQKGIESVVKKLT